MIPSTLALASARANDLFRQVGPWLAALVVFVVAGWMIIAWMRRRLRVDVSQDAPFTLDTLRMLHRQGKLSDEEYRRARDAIIAAAKRGMTTSAGRGDRRNPR